MNKPVYFLIFFCFILFLSVPAVLAQDEESDTGFVVILPGSSLDGLFSTQNQAILLSEAPREAKNIFYECYYLGLVGEDCQMAVDNSLDFLAELTAVGSCPRSD